MTSSPFISLRDFFTSMTLIRHSILSTQNGYIALDKIVIVFQHCRDFLYSSGNVLAPDPSHTVVKPAKLQCMPEAVSHTQSFFHEFPDQVFFYHVRDSAFIKDI